jgi:hypothetical protein
MSSTETVEQPQPQQATVENGNGEATKQELEQSQKITDASTSGTAWGQYLNSLNAKYQDKIRKAAQQSKYSLTIRNSQGQDESLTFTRMKLLQYQYDEIEDLRAESSEAASANKSKEANKLLRTMYAKAATYILWNVREKRPMTEQEYKMSAFSEVRPALDASILLGLVSDPN